MPEIFSYSNLVLTFLQAGAFDVSHLFSDDPNIHYTYAIGIRLFWLFLLFALASPMFLLGAALMFFSEPRIIQPDGSTPIWAILLTTALFLGAPMGLPYVLLAAFLFFALVAVTTLLWRKSPKTRQEYIWPPQRFRKANFLKKVFAFSILCVFLYFTNSLISAAYYSTVPLNNGQPEFRLQFPHRLNRDVVRASYSFPDTQSCLETGADTGNHEDLLRMDWDKISTTGDAKVCMFRLLHEWGGAADAASWLEAQGFRVSETFSSDKPYENRDGTLRVDGGWSIKRNGPRFPTSGVLARIRKAVPYGMGVRATFSEDGRELLYLNVDFSTL
ncbi:hypothetical protein [Ruegeria sp. SCP11]|uniref:hypothetical protein n=1 Tax=Ruegeria sp. SCP11 TaxID=3141378 RepID=UPI00333C1F69